MDWVLQNPDPVYYCGPSEDERARARAAAQKECDERQACYPTLRFVVISAYDQIDEVASDARHRGEYDLL